MLDFFSRFNYPTMALFAALFTWLITTLGAAVVFFFKKVNKTIMDAMLGFAAGVMIAASFFSLLSPAIEMAENLQLTGYIVAAIGVMLGAILLFTGDKIFDKLQSRKNFSSKSSFKRCLMLIFSITIHNIPEG